MRRWLVLAACLLTLAGVQASPSSVVKVKFHTKPDKVNVFLRTDPVVPPQFLGTSDQEIALDLSRLKGQDSYVFIFRAPGYLDTWSNVYDFERNKGRVQEEAMRQWDALEKGSWPPPGESKLQEIVLPLDIQTTVVFWTYPPGAVVYLPNASTPHAQGKPIGVAGQPVQLSSSDFWNPAQPNEGRAPTVQFRQGLGPDGKPDPHWYYQDSVPFEATGVFENKRFPAEGSYNLTPTTAWAPAYWYVRLHPGTVAAGGIGFVALSLLAFLYERNRRKAFAVAEARGKRMADLENLGRLKEDQWIGKLLGHWRLTKKLGAGGMAVVYEAIDDADLLLGDQAPRVALKLMNVELSDNEEFRKRFEREIDVCKKLSDPTIVRVEDFGNQDGHLYLVMELVDGEPLRDLVRPNFPIREALDYFEQILGGLAHAHREGVVHRDLKPDNIMLTKDGRIKIMDFGLARKQDVNTQITQSGAVLGTPAYVSPEQITGGGMNKSSDQYSLGITFYEILTGRRPFTNEDSVALLFSHLSEQATTMREWRPEIPESVDKVVLRMLLKDPSERFADLEECLKALRAARKDTRESGPSQRGLNPPKPKSFNTNIAN